MSLFRQSRLRWRRLILVGAIGCASGLAAVPFADRAVIWAARPFIYTKLERVPERPVAIVFGARVYPGGALSHVLRERVLAAAALYHAGKVRKLLMTGDNSHSNYDEVTPMKAFAVEHGVPAVDIVRDYAGFRTLDSCYRARSVFGVQQAILVTQAYHLPRAIITARRLGIDAVGFAADPGVDRATLARFKLRENLAVCSALLDTSLLHRKPHFLGPPEPIFQDERPDR